MKYSEDYISNFGKQTGFINSNIEKVIRLLDILISKINKHYKILKDAELKKSTENFENYYKKFKVY